MDGILELLSERFRHIVGRASGPLNFRLVVMPTVVTILAIRAHLRDVREGHPLYLGAFFTSQAERRRLLRSGLRDFGKVFVVACVLDAIYQVLVLRGFYPGEMLIVAVVCALVPYFVIRGPVTRIVNSALRRWRGAAAPTPAITKQADGQHERQETADER
jgi:hypothetical protein